MPVDEKIVALILNRKGKRTSKAEIVRRYRDEILELRGMKMSLKDICAYLETKYSLSVSPETLKKAVPELAKSNYERVMGLISSFSCSELRRLITETEKMLEKCSGQSDE